MTMHDDRKPRKRVKAVAMTKSTAHIQLKALCTEEDARDLLSLVCGWTPLMASSACEPRVAKGVLSML